MPQERKRIFYIGFRKDLHVLYRFPQPIEDRVDLFKAIKDLEASAVPSLSGNKHNPDSTNNNEYFVDSYSPIYMSRNRVKTWDEQGFGQTMPTPPFRAQNDKNR